MVVVRLARKGAKNYPFYHIVVTDSRKPRDSGLIEKIGYFNPFAKENETSINLDEERLKHWRSVGAQLSDRVAGLVRQHANSKQSKPKKSKPKTDQEELKTKKPDEAKEGLQPADASSSAMDKEEQESEPEPGEIAEQQAEAKSAAASLENESDQASRKDLAKKESEPDKKIAAAEENQTD